MRLSDKVGDHFRFRNAVNGEVGIEIEMEARNAFPPVENTSYYWNKEHDGSLRGEYNIEYVLKKPLKIKFAIKALDKLSAELEEYDTEVEDSVRAGTHIHINVRDLTFLELWVMVTCWYVLEELLTHTMCGEGRKGNHFCLGVQDADAVLYKVTNILKGNHAFDKLKGGDLRYSALNFSSLFKYGSLEFRALRTPQNFDEIKVWMCILLAIKENSKLFRNPRQVVENFSYGGERNFLRQILGNENANIVLERDPDGWERKMKRGVRIAQEIAYAREDWEENNKIKVHEVCKELLMFAEEFGIEVVDHE